MTNKTYLCHIFIFLPFLSYKDSLDALKKGNLRHLIGNIRRIILRYFLYFLFKYPSIFRHRLVKSMGSHKAGISHITRDMIDLIKESIDLNSTAVILPFQLASVHNLGKEYYSTSDIYYNLSDSYYVTPAGEKKNIRVIQAKDFLKMRNWYRVRFFCQYETMHPAKETGNTINVRWRDDVEHLEKRPENPNILFFEYNDGTQIHLCLADDLINKVESVSSTLGEYYLLRVRMPWDGHTPYNKELLKKKIMDWEMVHRNRAAQGIGRGQKEAIAFGNQQSYDTLQDWTYGEGLREQLLKIFPRGSNVYIMSNLWKPFDEDYFGPLRSSFKVYRYYDFPELVQLAEGEKPNTAQLKLIEMQLQEQSTDSLTLDYLRPITTCQNMQSRFN